MVYFFRKPRGRRAKKRNEKHGAGLPIIKRYWEMWSSKEQGRPSNGRKRDYLKGRRGKKKNR